MDFLFNSVTYDRTAFLQADLPAIPKASGIYRIFDTRGKLIVLDKTSNLAQKLERYYGERSEMIRDLDLREITSRIEYIRTASAFETMYLLYRERRELFPRTYRRMRTFRPFTLMKINTKQRFPRIYASRQIKAGVDYFGPFVTRGQFTRMKTALERTFKLRPCLFNIRGGDPHPDCMYFQMHTCSRPCNDDIGRRDYLEDVRDAMRFIQGRDAEVEQRLLDRIAVLASEMKFEEAEHVRRRLDKLKKARQEDKDTFFAVKSFNYLVLLPALTSALCRIAFIREGSIVGFEEYETASIAEKLESDLREVYEKPAAAVNYDWKYDEFCIACNFLVGPLQTVTLIPVTPDADLPGDVARLLAARKRRRKPNGDRSACTE